MIQIALNLNLPLFASQLRFDCLRANNFITHQKLVFFFLDVPSDILALLNKYGMLQRCSRCDKQIERWNKKKKTKLSASIVILFDVDMKKASPSHFFFHSVRAEFR